MISQKMNRVMKEVLLPGLIAVFALAVLGSWTYALVLDLKVRRALKIDLPDPARKPEPAKAAPAPGSNANTPKLSGPPAGPPTSPVPPGASAPPPPGSPPGVPAGAPAAPSAASLPKEVEELVKAKSLFGRQPDNSGNASVQGVLGDSALVNGQWMKIGQPNGNIVVKEIAGNKVVLEVNGQRREMTIWPQLPGT
jgi:hypothetical protein